MYRGEYIEIKDFSGGLCTNLPAVSLATNQATVVDNCVVTPGGGFRSRLGNSKINTSAFNSGANMQGLGYFLKSDGTESLVCVAGTKFGINTKSAGSYATSFTDKTGSVTITSGQNNLWNFCTFNDKVIGFGGSKDSPDAPITWDGTASNATTLTGSPPSAYGGFSANNRVFAFRTSANPSTIYWSILSSATDWTGVGSGSAVIGAANDNSKITGAAVLSTNYAFVFKDTSTYQMVLTAAPFPIYTFSSSVGCVGKNAVVNVNGTVYWINQYYRMVSSDGNGVTSYPPNDDEDWEQARAQGRGAYITGIRQNGADYDWIVWTITRSGTTNNVALIWDLTNKCWLECSSGYKMNCGVTDGIGELYMGDYAGFVYIQDQTGIYADASESSPGTITAVWRSGWLNAKSPEGIVQPNELGLTYNCKASGTITIDYGFNFISDSKTATISQVASGAETDGMKYIKVTGRGNYFNFRIKQSSSTIDMKVYGIFIRGKKYGQKVFSNP